MDLGSYVKRPGAQDLPWTFRRIRRSKGEGTPIGTSWLACALLTSVIAAIAQSPDRASPDVDLFRGTYKVSKDHAIGIDTFVNDDGRKVLLFSDYKSGAVRELFRVSDDEYEMGPGFAVRTPVELRVRFLLHDNEVRQLLLRTPRGTETAARRIATREKDVSFRSGDATLRGTLLVPERAGPSPAIILLHGSGPLTRSSFGPYPRFFVSLGFAVLVYDKRGAGESTGEYMPHDAFYPAPFLSDALAAIQFLRSESGIDHERIGLWGSSEGGMLATQVAAQSTGVAFIINSCGFMMPLWQQMLYNRRAELKADGYSAAEAADAVDYQNQLFEVGKTGDGWSRLHESTVRLRDREWFGRFFETGTPDAETLRWRWQHVYSFDPLPAVPRVHCPVLGLFGALDTSTPAEIAVANLGRALASGGNVKTTLRVFPHANHSLTLTTTGSERENARATGQAPGVFDPLRDFLGGVIHPARPYWGQVSASSTETWPPTRRS